jgi:hypothetical protein
MLDSPLRKLLTLRPKHIYIEKVYGGSYSYVVVNELRDPRSLKLAPSSVLAKY